MANKGQSGFSIDKNAVDVFSQLFGDHAGAMAGLVQEAKSMEAYFSSEMGHIDGEEAEEVRRTLAAAGVYMSNIQKVVDMIKVAADQTLARLDESTVKANATHAEATDKTVRVNTELKK